MNPNINQEMKFGEIKHVKLKKKLLEDFISDINKKCKDEIDIKKNKLVLKILFTRIKDIDEKNIILEHKKDEYNKDEYNKDEYKIINIEGINITENGLITLNNKIYKPKPNKFIKIFGTGK